MPNLPDQVDMMIASMAGDYRLASRRNVNMTRLALCICTVAALSGQTMRAQNAPGPSEFVLAPMEAAQEGGTHAADSPEAALARIRTHIHALLSKPQPGLFAGTRSVLALSEEEVQELQFAGAQRNERAKESLGYLQTIESGLDNDDAQRPEAYLVEGRRSLDLARLSRSDGTLQLYAISLPAHWDAHKAYPLYVQLHGRWSDLPLALVASTLAPHDEYRKQNEDAIVSGPMGTRK